MATHEVKILHPSLPGYENEAFRARAGYKELHQHDPPARRNRDFKPVPYGSAKGPLNYRHSEAWCMLKNMKDLPRETHHVPITMTKEFMKGAIVGGILGQYWFIGSPSGALEYEKAVAASGGKAFSGRTFRLMKNTLGKYMALGGTLMVSYHGLKYWMRRHDEANPRTAWMDHLYATVIMGTVGSAFVFNRPTPIFVSAFFSGMLVAPMTWWFSLQGVNGKN